MLGGWEKCFLHRSMYIQSWVRLGGRFDDGRVGGLDTERNGR